jgi:mRNA interferase MazF
LNLRRGDIWLVDFGDPVGREQAGTRPAVVVSADGLNDSAAGIAIVIPTTTTHRRLPSHVELEPDGTGLREVSYAKCEDIKSVSTERLVARLGSVNEAAMFDLGRALRFLLEL